MTDDSRPPVEDAWYESPHGSATQPATDMPLGRTRTAAPAPIGPSRPGPTAEAVSQHYSSHLSDTSASAFMYFSMAGVFRQADAPAYKLFRDRLLAECGGPTDPIEVILIEQLALAHLNSGRLHFRAATSDSLEAARVYGSMAIMLMGEFRRGALALKSYRDKPQSAERSPAAGGDVARAGSPDREGVDGEQGSNPRGDEHDGGTILLAAESPTGRGGPAKSGAAARAHRRRA
jgi:hypothetical protein